MRRTGVSVMAMVGLLAVGFMAWGQTAEDGPELPDVVINEIELNPPGFDTNAEWVEILNRDQAPIDLADWSLTYNYPSEAVQVLSDEPLVIQPGERFVYTFSGLCLRNATPFAIRLINPAGIVVDQASPFTDTANDDSTWQRFPDGGDPLWPDLWLFNPATKNRTND